MGAALVIAPFPTVGLVAGRFVALATSIVLMVVATTASGVFTAVSSNARIGSTVARNVGLSLLALTVTYLVGSLAHLLGASVA